MIGVGTVGSYKEVSTQELRAAGVVEGEKESRARHKSWPGTHVSV